MIAMQTYKAAYHWTQEELLRSMRHHYQTNLRPSIVMAVNIFSVLLSVLSLSILVADGPKSPAIMSACLFISFTIYWLFLRQGVANWWVGRGFIKRPDANALVEWEISGEKVMSKCEGLGFSESQWKLFIKVVETNDGFLFYLQKNLFYWLPFSAFEQTEGIEQVRQSVKAHEVQYVLKV